MVLLTSDQKYITFRHFILEAVNMDLMRSEISSENLRIGWKRIDFCSTTKNI